MFSNPDAVGTSAGRRRLKFIGFNLLLLGLGAAPMVDRLSENGWTVAGLILFLLFLNMSVLSERLLLEGPLALTTTEKRTLLWDADAMLATHQKLWCSPATYLHEWWQSAFGIYNEDSARQILRQPSFAELKR
jgi:hypothetical protein